MGFDLHIGGSFSKHNPLYKSLPVKMYAAIHTGRGKGNIAPWRRREMEDETFGERNVELWLKTKEGKNDFDSFSTQIFGDIVCLVLHSFAEGQRTDGGGGNLQVSCGILCIFVACL